MQIERDLGVKAGIELQDISSCTLMTMHLFDDSQIDSAGAIDWAAYEVIDINLLFACPTLTQSKSPSGKVTWTRWNSAL